MEGIERISKTDCNKESGRNEASKESFVNWEKPMVVSYNKHELSKARNVTQVTSHCSYCWC
jgi:hypothetical protein